MTCTQCVPMNNNSLRELEFMSIEIRNDGLYKVTCQNGHTSITWLQNQKFEILFDMAAMALLDSYNREAVTSMAASLERFYEFYIKVILLKHSVEFKVFEEAWKHVINQSERQLGAFLFLYILENKRLKTIDQKFYTFRNNVIHKGYIPSYDEVIEYGEHIYQFIVTILKELKEASGDSFWKVITHEATQMHSKENERLIKSTMSISTIISHAYGDIGSKTFKQKLDELKQSKRFKYIK